MTSASLNNSTGGTFPLVSSSNPIPINVTKLQTDTAFLGNVSVPAATYDSLSVTFANPQLSIYNGSGATIGTGANACLNNTVCQLTPTASPLTLSFSTTPFPIDLTASSPLAFMLDVHLDNVIQQDLSVNLEATNGVTISQLPIPPSGQHRHLGHLVGTVQSVTPQTGALTGFTLQSLFGKTFTIDVNSSTTYNYPSAVCSADNSTCVGAQQIVKVEVTQQSDGSLLASEVDYLQAAGQIMVEGNILRLSSSGGNTLMDLILQSGPNAPNTLPLGGRVTVTVPSSGVTYAIDNGTFTLPGGLSFAQATDLVPGQAVTVTVQGPISKGGGSGSSSGWGNKGGITFATNSVTLEPSQITGLVTTVNASGMTFTLGWDWGFFTPFSSWGASAPNLTSNGVNVITTGQTTFTDFTTDTISGVAANDLVSVQGWLYLTPGATTSGCTTPSQCATNTTLVGQTVTDRPTPTF